MAAVAGVLAFAAFSPASAGATTARASERPATVVDNFHTGQSRTEVAGTESPLLGVTSGPDASAAVAPAEEGARKVAVVLVNVPGGIGGTWSPEVARSRVFTASNSANAFYKEESYDEISLTGKLRPDGDVFGPFAVTPKSSGCAYLEWNDEADQAAEEAGVDLSSYQHIIYEIPLHLECNWSGIAGLGGTRVDLNGNVSSGTVAHELGHNLGLAHAGSWTCTEGGVRVQISDTCTASEYGDPFDTMGGAAANRHNSGWNLAKLGILEPGNVETVTESGVYSIRSALTKTSQPTVLRIARKRSPSKFVTSWYYLEIRQVGGVFESGSDASMTGISIRATAEGATPETLLLDANPSTATFADAPLQPGQVFDGGRVKVKTLSAGAGQATVEVQLKTSPPAAPENLHATVSADGVQLDWTNADSADVDRYRVYRDGELLGSDTPRSYLDFRPLAGEHEYTVVAEDEEENLSGPSAPLTVDVPVVSGPTCSAGKCKVSFLYSGVPAIWTVPPGVDEASVTAEGARGGGRTTASEGFGAFGARIWATLGPLAPGETAEVSVGGRGDSYSEAAAGGFNGGGDGASGGGGGGYTKLELESTLEVLAGGGGGGGLNGHNDSLKVSGGGGGSGGEQGKAGSRGAQTLAEGATLKGGGGGGGGGTGGEGGQVVGTSTCGGGASAGVPGGAGSSLQGGEGVAEGGGGGGGGYVGGGQGGAGAGDACGDRGGYGGGGGGSSFVTPGHLVGSETAGADDGWLGIAYADPVTASPGEYTTLGAQELDVSADLGVLAGSLSPEPGPPVASLISSPAYGSLTLEADGSFTYAPDPGFLGSDSFVYRATDAAGDYADATVSLNVAGPPSATVSSPAQGGTYVVGQAVQTAFSCSEGPGGTGVLSCKDSNGTTSAAAGAGHLDTATVGHHTYTVTAISKDGLTDEASFEYEVVPAPPGEESPSPRLPGDPAPPGPPETGRPKIEFPASAANGSLRKLLRTGRFDVRVRLSAPAKLMLSGRAKLLTVLVPKSISFTAAGERTATLILTQKGRRALRHLNEVTLVIIAEASNATGATVMKRLLLRLGD